MQGGVAAAGEAPVFVHRPFEAGVTGAEGAAVEAEEAGGFDGKHLDEARAGDGFLFVDAVDK